MREWWVVKNVLKSVYVVIECRLWLLAVLMCLAIKQHTVPLLKGVNSGLELQTSRGSSSMGPMLASKVFILHNMEANERFVLLSIVFQHKRLQSYRLEFWNKIDVWSWFESQTIGSLDQNLEDLWPTRTRSMYLFTICPSCLCWMTYMALAVQNVRACHLQFSKMNTDRSLDKPYVNGVTLTD